MNELNQKLLRTKEIIKEKTEIADLANSIGILIESTEYSNNVVYNSLIGILSSCVAQMSEESDIPNILNLMSNSLKNQTKLRLEELKDGQ